MAKAVELTRLPRARFVTCPPPKVVMSNTLIMQIMKGLKKSIVRLWKFCPLSIVVDYEVLTGQCAFNITRYVRPRQFAPVSKCFMDRRVCSGRARNILTLSSIPSFLLSIPFLWRGPAPMVQKPCKLQVSENMQKTTCIFNHVNVPQDTGIFT